MRRGKTRTLAGMNDGGSAGLERVLQLFNVAAKNDVKKYCRDLVIHSDDLTNMILAGRVSALRPYEYACHFSQIEPEHLNPTERNFAALAVNGVGPLSREARKTVTKVFQIFQDRRIFSAHLFYTPSNKFWHLFYFDQRDVTDINNHWKAGGPHIHYSRESFTSAPLAEVWRRICARPPNPPPSVHVRYDYHHNRNRKHAG